MITVHFSDMHGGGYAKLSTEQNDALLARGWRIRTGDREPSPERLEIDIHGLDPAHGDDWSLDSQAENIARKLFEHITGENSYSAQCACCGSDFSFYAL